MVRVMVSQVWLGSVYNKWSFSLTEIRCRGMTLHLATIDIHSWSAANVGVLYMYGYSSHCLCTLIATRYLAATLHPMQPMSHTC